jgi:endonuclease-3 related protein
MQPLNLYKKLFSFFGEQNWWPVTSKGKIKPEYKKRKNLTEKQKLEVCFGAILTQNTSWGNVEKAITGLNKRNLIDAKKILSIKKENLAEIIKSAGYFNQKSAYLKEFCLNLKKYNYSVNSFFSSSADLRKELLGIKGIGKETADSILLYSVQKPFFVVDAYTKRILSRINGEKEKSYDELQNFFHSTLKKDFELFNEFHALLVEHAKQFCQKKPLCSKCFLRKECVFGKNNEF